MPRKKPSKNAGRYAGGKKRCFGQCQNTCPRGLRDNRGSLAGTLRVLAFLRKTGAASAQLINRSENNRRTTVDAEDPSDTRIRTRSSESAYCVHSPVSLDFEYQKTNNRSRGPCHYVNISIYILAGGGSLSAPATTFGPIEQSVKVNVRSTGTSILSLSMRHLV